MLVIALSRLSLLPHLKVPDLIMTAHMTRRGCDVSYSIVVCLVGDGRSSWKHSMSSDTTKLDFAGVAIKVKANKVQRHF